MSQIDYFERAKRLEEIPLIKKAYEEQRVKDMELWELQEEERVCWKHNRFVYSYYLQRLKGSTSFCQVQQNAFCAMNTLGEQDIAK